MEKIQNNSRMIKQALAGMATRQGLNHVTSPHLEDNTQHMESCTKTELEQLCLAEAGRCITQSGNNTIPTVTTLGIIHGSQHFHESF